MARKKALPAHHDNRDRWLVSYADFITLLFAFFVVMFASSQTDRTKAQIMSDAVKQAFEKGGISPTVREILGGTVDERGKGNAMMKGPGGTEKTAPPTPASMAELAPSMQYLSKALETEIQDGKVQVHLEPRGLVVSLRQATFFPSGEDTVDPGTYPSMDKIGATIRDLPNGVRLEGHTDSVPIHSTRFRSNWELSTARSIAMLELLSKRYEIPQSRLAVAGYADTIPVDTNDSPEGRAHNRRVDIVILSQQFMIRNPAAVEPVPHAANKENQAAR